MATTEKALRESIVAHGARIVASGLGDAPDCDVSARFRDSLLITPSGANYASLRPAMIALMPLTGEYGAWAGPIKPSGEWRIHLDITRARPDIGAIVRFQSPYATALAMARKPIPAAHSMIRPSEAVARSPGPCGPPRGRRGAQRERPEHKNSAEPPGPPHQGPMPAGPRPRRRRRGGRYDSRADRSQLAERGR